MAPVSDNRKSIFLISGDTDLVSGIRDNLVRQGYAVDHFTTPAGAFSALNEGEPDILVLDLQSAPPQEMDLVHFVKTRYPFTEIIVLTVIETLDAARHAMHHGASFYLIKPVASKDIKIALDQVARRVDQRRDQVRMERQLLSNLMADSPVMGKVLKMASKIAPTSSTVLLAGESGTGKEFFARIIHRQSKYSMGKFVAVNCGAIPDTLFESEFFGHRRGAFTGADRDKEGLVEEANDGTLFLDEVGELTPPAQVKLLRFIQEQSFRRIGENAQRSVHVRLIAATNRNLYKEVEDGRFREDLFYRLNVFYLYLPPLRERKETLPGLIRLFVHRNNALLNKEINTITKPAEVLLANYTYPGNIRELENIIEHAAALSEGNVIKESDLPDRLFSNRQLLAAPSRSLPEIGDRRESILPLADMEKEQIARALEATGYNYTETAGKLGISRSTLWRKIKNYHIETPGSEPA